MERPAGGGQGGRGVADSAFPGFLSPQALRKLHGQPRDRYAQIGGLSVGYRD